MNVSENKNVHLIKLNDIPCFDRDDFLAQLIIRCRMDKRVVAYFGVPEKSRVKVYAVLADDERGGVHVSSAFFPEKGSYSCLTHHLPSFHMFERELFEQTGILPEGHPWLKPVRYCHDRADRKSSMAGYPFYTIPGEEVHEVAVGPVHAGVIEPGHFRFMCNGEKVYHLEIQLGYQHRGVEELFPAHARFMPHLAESIAGDTAIGHNLAYCQAMEALADIEVTENAMLIRDIALELERIAVHINDLAAIASDVAYLLGNAVLGAVRTLVINTTQAVCGNRFGKGLIRPGGVLFNIDKADRPEIKKTLKRVKDTVRDMCGIMFSSPTVLSRLEKTGVVEMETAHRIGLVGMSARASGLGLDIRSDFPDKVYGELQIPKIVLPNGDVYSRARIRFLEILSSIEFIEKALDGLREDGTMREAEYKLEKESMAISLTEGWRGEIVHVGLTDEDGKLVRYKVKDPSFNNWFGLSLAVRNNGVSDFPLCNKSFNLSYCGHDL
ncbi:MAG: NADH-quinone oxidoreductase subunit C [bacterium]|nr:NADH-quinone oxidoreductase subunit C [bacterium]